MSGRTIALWVGRVLMAALFLAAGGAKLAGTDFMVGLFDKIGLGQWFRVFTGATEVILALMLLTPSLSGLAAILLLGVCAGAVLAQLAIPGGDIVHVLVVATPVALLAWFQRDAVTALIGGRPARGLGR